MPIQASLFPDAPPPGDHPPGFRYTPDLIDGEEERRLVAGIAALPLKPFEFHGYLANRRVVSFGYRYDYARRAVAAAPEVPAFLLDLRTRVAAWAGVAPDDFRQLLINEYAPGAGIGWHRDKPQFGLVAGLSLLSPAILRFRRREADDWRRAAAPLAPRSVYLLAGEARSVWEHSIIEGDALRYSVTFRTLA
ncbi:alpha-ketoglutarate-dependent dioxygenase AlkB [Nitrospirillum viridazoti]|uniref:Alkylated DNA repair dioxygenase AlkB n=1 Tax=Nitrospirillum amazonense TaxID=28077 RepID=A0A560IHR9_9PROT|nr:alpha-ketoglutarate-dependent dioxygenase AlkB [Nitrospirillum amazonense]TWB58588.1 alkylated DNA repair dioxygenase AlkB [Nitrospirillum amazonense]